MGERYVCIHAHFYQPPRENPWLDTVEPEASAAPYHDWNERVAAECYTPNAAAPVIDELGQVTRVLNNYSHLSFNVGPTLLSWMERRAPDTYAAILEADRLSRERFSGHGSALAQPYNHLIMPLATARDRRTQVVWGIRDFVWRFGRQPEGMWLPETAVDLDTLEALADGGVRFTILAPHQAAAVRRPPDGDWQGVGGGRIDPRRAYIQRLPSGREIALFFYDGEASRAVAFEPLLEDGESFVRRLETTVPAEGLEPSLIHIATDGETYGHHHAAGEVALAFALSNFAGSPEARLTNYGEFLERHPPRHEVRIEEGTSWSCAHGVERWRSDCGCSTGERPEWSQAWRGPLRESLDELATALAGAFETEGESFLRDPWRARDEYIDVILDRSPGRTAEFISRHGEQLAAQESRNPALKLLEMQRHAMLMFTSCGWFFDDPAGIETRQVLLYAGRALDLAENMGLEAAREAFLTSLEGVRSNREEVGDGRHIFTSAVAATRVTSVDVGVQAAADALFGTRETSDYGPLFSVRLLNRRPVPMSTGRVVAGRLQVTSNLEEEELAVCFATARAHDAGIQGGLALTGAVEWRQDDPPLKGDDCREKELLLAESLHRGADPTSVLRQVYPLRIFTQDDLRPDGRARVEELFSEAGAESKAPAEG
jgi:hypothetical protein